MYVIPYQKDILWTSLRVHFNNSIQPLMMLMKAIRERSLINGLEMLFNHYRRKSKNKKGLFYSPFCVRESQWHVRSDRRLRNSQFIYVTVCPRAMYMTDGGWLFPSNPRRVLTVTSS